MKSTKTASAPVPAPFPVYFLQVSGLLALSLLHCVEAAGFRVFQLYGKPVGDWARIDIDQRAIVARTSLTSLQGLLDAKKVYTQGVNSPSGSTLQALGTGEVFRDHPTFKAFQSFYGDNAEYADQWVQGAFNGTSVVLGSRTAAFPSFDVDGLSRAVRWSPLLLNVWMAVVSSMEESLAACGTDPAVSQQGWDRAFALYTGSLAESDPAGGYLLYNLAQVQCLRFGTCEMKGEAAVNTEIIQNFVEGKGRSRKGDCPPLKENFHRIHALMKVPLIQGTLRSMYAMDVEGDIRSETQGEAAAFGAAVAPILSICSPDSADILYEDTSPGNGPTGSFEVVKSGFERNLACLRITCQDVGGLISHRGDTYLDRAEACDGVQPMKGAGFGSDETFSANDNNSSTGAKTKNKRALALVIVSGIIAGILVLGLGCRRACKKEDEKCIDVVENPEANAEEGSSSPIDVVADESADTLVETTQAKIV